MNFLLLRLNLKIARLKLENAYLRSPFASITSFIGVCITVSRIMRTRHMTFHAAVRYYDHYLNVQGARVRAELQRMKENQTNTR